MSEIRIKIPGRSLNPGQRALLDDTTRNVALLGGFGSGKTTAAVLKLLQLKGENPDTPGLLVAPNWRTLWAVDYRALRSVLSSCLSPAEMPRLVDRTQECYLDFGDGVPVFLRSASKIDSFDGVNVGWSILDEARYYSREAWQVIKGRVRLQCKLPQTVVASTPAFGVLSDEFDSGRAGRRCIIAPTTENAHNLVDGFVDDLKQSYSKRALQAFLEGRFCVLEGAVFEDFDPSLDSGSIVDFDPRTFPLVEAKVYLAVDPGYRRSAWQWWVQTGPTEYVCFDQLSPDNRSDTDCVRAVNARGWPIDEIIIDPAARAMQSYEAASTLTAVRGIKCRGPRPIRMLRGANREIAYGVERLRVMLGCEDNPNRMMFSRQLLDAERGQSRGVIKNLSAYRYPELKDGKPVSDQPLKDGINDHHSDASRYLAVYLWHANPALKRLDYEARKRPATDRAFDVAA